MIPATLLLGHAAATLAMTGLIWFVQLVHYPLFRFASRPTFAEFSRQHRRRTGWVVMPLMLGELATALLLVVRAPDLWTLTGALLLAIIWLSTALLQVPLHRRLARGFDTATARALARSNWIRTIAWTARAGIALLLVVRSGI